MIKKYILNIVRLNNGFKRRLSKIYYSLVLERLGENCQIDLHLYMPGVENISIGNNCVLNRGCVIQSCDGAKVVIGDDVIISYGVKILTGGLDCSANGKAARKHLSNDINISKNTWLGANSVILPGVTIGKGVVVAAGSVVTKDVNDYCLVGGVPAKFIKYTYEVENNV